MRISWIARVTGAVWLPFLIACSTNGNQVPPTVGLQRFATDLRHVPSLARQPAASHDMIYVDYFQNGNHTPLRFYSEGLPHRKLGEIRRGIYVAHQLAVNRQGSILVANQSNTAPFGGIYIFAPGALKPSKILTVPKGSGLFIYGVCSGPGGTVYGASGGGLGSPALPVYAYAHGSTTPTTTVYTYPATYQPKACAVDSKGNLYVLYYVDNSGNFMGAIDEFKPGSHTPTTLKITLQNVAYIGVDASDDLLVTGNFVGEPPGLFVFPQGASVPSRTFDSGGQPIGFTVSSSGSDLYIVDVSIGGSTQTAVLDYDYASGKKIHQFWAGGKEFFGLQDIAVTPRSQ